MGLEIIGDTMPGGVYTFAAMAVLITSLLSVKFTGNAWVSLFAGFGTCWGMTLMGWIPIWTSLLCTLGVMGGLAAWRLWVRD